MFTISSLPSRKFNYMIGSIGDLVKEIKIFSGTILSSSNSLTSIRKGMQYECMHCLTP